MAGAALAALLLAAAAALSLPLAVRWIIDSGFGIHDSAAIAEAFRLSLLLALFLALASAARYYCVSWLGERIATDLRCAVYDHLLRLEPGFFDFLPTGEAISRLAADATIIRTALGSSASIALRNMVLLAGAVVLMVISSPSLSLLMLVLIPAIALPLLALGRRVRRLSRRAQDDFADTQAQAGEALNAIRSVQSFTREDAESARFVRASEAAFASARRRIGVRALLTALLLFLVFAAIAGVLWQGAALVSSGAMTGGLLGQFIIYAVLAAGALAALGDVWGEIQLAAGAAERLEEILSTRARIISPRKPIAFPPDAAGEIIFDRVSFAYPSRPSQRVLRDVSFRCAAEGKDKGKIIAFAGASGAGKSSIFHLLQRFDDPQSGRIFLDGVDIRCADLAALRRRFAPAGQDAPLFSMTLAENIAYGRPDADAQEIEAAAHFAAASAFIKALPQGYDTLAGASGRALSGGERQRIALARAWARREAGILLLDEATAALDSENEATIHQGLTQWVSGGGRLALVIAHHPALWRLADEIILLADGDIAATGNHANLMKESALYRRLAGSAPTEA